MRPTRVGSSCPVVVSSVRSQFSSVIGLQSRGLETHDERTPDQVMDTDSGSQEGRREVKDEEQLVSDDHGCTRAACLAAEELLRCECESNHRSRRLHFSLCLVLALASPLFLACIGTVRMAQVPKSYPRPGPLGQTDPNRWRLSSATDGGRHVWHYARDPDAPETTGPYEPVWGPDSERLREQEEQNDETAYWLGLDLPFPTDKVSTEPAATPIQAAHKGESRIYPFSQIERTGSSQRPRRI